MKAILWFFKIGWEHLYYEPWLHSFSHCYRNRKTGEIRWHHEKC